MPLGRGSAVLTTSGLDATHNYYARACPELVEGWQYIDDTGLCYYGSRYYDREIGAFISPAWTNRSAFRQSKRD